MSDNTKGKNIGYWLVTGLLALVLLAAGVMDLMGRPEVMQVLDRLGYPAYLAALLGVAKLLGVFAITVPGLPRLKEWAYAGIVFDLGGAVYSHIRAGEAEQILAPVVLLGLTFASWYLRPLNRKLPDLIKIS